MDEAEREHHMVIISLSMVVLHLKNNLCLSDRSSFLQMPLIVDATAVITV